MSFKRNDTCFIPSCQARKRENINKRFFMIPKNLKNKWIEAAGLNTDIYSTKRLHCCEDHFDPEEDIHDWHAFLRFQGNIKFKKNVVPHKKMGIEEPTIPKEPINVSTKEENRVEINLTINSTAIADNSSQMTKKTCFICLETSTDFPKRTFFYVPKAKKAEWMKLFAAVAVDSSKIPANVYCCENHFIVEEDIKDYNIYKKFGGKVVFKRDVMPRLYLSQQPTTSVLLQNEDNNMNLKSHNIFASNKKRKCDSLSEETISTPKVNNGTTKKEYSVEKIEKKQIVLKLSFGEPKIITSTDDDKNKIYCFICKEHCPKSLNRTNITDNMGNYKIKYNELLQNVIGMNFRLDVFDTDIICPTCIVLFEYIYKLQQKTKNYEQLVVRQVYRNYNIEKQFDPLQIDEKAMQSFTIDINNEFSCNDCTYKTSYSDRITPHFNYHQHKDEYIKQYCKSQENESSLDKQNDYETNDFIDIENELPATMIDYRKDVDYMDDVQWIDNCNKTINQNRLSDKTTKSIKCIGNNIENTRKTRVFTKINDKINLVTKTKHAKKNVITVIPTKTAEVHVSNTNELYNKVNNDYLIENNSNESSQPISVDSYEYNDNDLDLIEIIETTIEDLEAIEGINTDFIDSSHDTEHIDVMSIKIENENILSDNQYESYEI